MTSRLGLDEKGDRETLGCEDDDGANELWNGTKGKSLEKDDFAGLDEGAIDG